MQKKFLVLGSCRVVNTVAYEIGNDILLNRNDLWFTHYIQEHIQKIKHLFDVENIPIEHKELFVRYEQESHYPANSALSVGKSLKSGKVELQECKTDGALNVIVELPTIRYIAVPISGVMHWGHTSSLGLIRESQFNQSGGYSSASEFLDLLNQFESELLRCALSKKIAAKVNFVYVPHNPFIESANKNWTISEQRTHIFDLIIQHCSQEYAQNLLPFSRKFIDVKKMIEDNGGVDQMLTDQNHYSLHGRKVAYKYIADLTD